MKSKIGSKESENRRTLNYARGLLETLAREKETRQAALASVASEINALSSVLIQLSARKKVMNLFGGEKYFQRIPEIDPAIRIRNKGNGEYILVSRSTTEPPSRPPLSRGIDPFGRIFIAISGFREDVDGQGTPYGGTELACDTLFQRYTGSYLTWMCNYQGLTSASASIIVEGRIGDQRSYQLLKDLISKKEVRHTQSYFGRDR